MSDGYLNRAKHRNAPLLWLAISVMAVACGCVTGSAAPVAATPPAPSPDRTASGWQERMATILTDDPAGYTEAWGLFSSGGWSDAGQTIVVGDPARKAYHVFIANPNEKAFAVDRALSPASFTQTLEPQVHTAESLSNLDAVAFDALTFEYLHMVKGEGGKTTVTKRLVIRNTGKTKAPAHEALIAAFQSLKKP